MTVKVACAKCRGAGCWYNKKGLRMEPCDRCDGTGKVDVAEAAEPARQDDTIPCQDCRGTGFDVSYNNPRQFLCDTCLGVGHVNKPAIPLTISKPQEESFDTISAWASQFGPVSDARLVARALEELVEFDKEFTSTALGNPDKLREECADVVIVLSRLVVKYQLDVDPGGRPPTPIRPDTWDSVNALVVALLGNFKRLRQLTNARRPPTREAMTSSIRNMLADLLLLASFLDCDIQAEVDKKMARNRARMWRHDGSGCSYHVKEG